MPWNGDDLLNALAAGEGLLAVGLGRPGPTAGAGSGHPRAPGRAALLSPSAGPRRTGTASSADAVRLGAAAVVVGGSHRAGTVPEILVRDGRRAALGRRPGAGTATRPASLTLIGITGTNGKTTTTGLVRHLFNAERHAREASGRWARSTGGRRGAIHRGQPDHARPGGPAGHLRGAGGARGDARGDGDLVAQPRPGPARRPGLRGRRLHQPHARPPRLPRHHGALPRREAPAERAARAGRRARRSTPDDPAWAAMPPRSPTRHLRVSTRADVRAEQRATRGAEAAASAWPGRFGSGGGALPLLGDFNVANALAAAALPRSALGLPLDAGGATGSPTAPQVPGRMERLADAPCVVLRDYAHTPDALERALATLRPLTPRAADRAVRLRRRPGPRQAARSWARIAAEGADLAIVTSRQSAHRGSRARSSTTWSRGMGARPAPPDRGPAARPSRALRRAAQPGDTRPARRQGPRDLPGHRHREAPFDERDIVRSALLGRRRVTWTDASGPGGAGLPASAGDAGRATPASRPTRGRWRRARSSWRSRGERFDGHDFLAEAAARGSARRGGPARAPRGCRGSSSSRWPTPWSRSDCWPGARRRRIAGPVVAITGTNGKTSTKEMLAAAAPHPVADPCHARQSEQPGRRAADDPRSARRYRRAGRRGGGQPAREKSAATGGSSSRPWPS